jgi:hypothetical protein
VVNVLNQKGVIKKAEALEDLKGLQAKAPTVR